MELQAECVKQYVGMLKQTINILIIMIKVLYHIFVISYYIMYLNALLYLIISYYIMYLNANNLYGWEMSQERPVDGFKWVEKLSKFSERFIKSYNENSDIGYFLEVDVEYPKRLFNLHKDLPFLPKREKIDKCKKLIYSIEDKERYVVHIRAYKQALTNGLKLKKVRRVI